VIQGIALGADLPVVPVSTLAAIAQDFFDHNDEDVAFFIDLNIRTHNLLALGIRNINAIQKDVSGHGPRRLDRGHCG
jgi:hypothetical protein